MNAKETVKYTKLIFIFFIALLLTIPTESHAQSKSLMHYIIEGNDTIYVDHLPTSTVSAKRKKKGKKWRVYRRLVHNFSKTYPYALAARNIVKQADQKIEEDKLKRLKRDKYIDEVQKELFEVFEEPLRNLTVSQGALLMKLIDREIGKSSYSIIKDYKNGIAASFWQGIAKLFGSDLKKPYDPDGEDADVESLVQLWEAGKFNNLYFSIFSKDPPKVDIPSKYR